MPTLEELRAQLIAGSKDSPFKKRSPFVYQISADGADATVQVVGDKGILGAKFKGPFPARDMALGTLIAIEAEYDLPGDLLDVVQYLIRIKKADLESKARLTKQQEDFAKAAVLIAEGIGKSLSAFGEALISIAEPISWLVEEFSKLDWESVQFDSPKEAQIIRELCDAAKVKPPKKGEWKPTSFPEAVSERTESEASYTSYARVPVPRIAEGVTPKMIGTPSISEHMDMPKRAPSKWPKPIILSVDPASSDDGRSVPRREHVIEKGADGIVRRMK